MLKDILTGLKSPAADDACESRMERNDVITLSDHGGRPLETLSVVIPARDEAGCIASTVEHLHLELTLHGIRHEIVVVDDGSRDETFALLQATAVRIPNLVPIRSPGPHGFGRAIQRGLDAFAGDAVVIMMADESDDCRDVVRYWKMLQQGNDCVFGSRFMKGGGVIDYPRVKYVVNRMANWFIRMLFGIRLNDTTNAFKAYRKEVIEGCRPFLSPHFNITVELPLKAIVRGYSWTVMPITWRNRRTGVAKLKIREMGSRYFFIVAYVWLEKYFSRGDYRKPAGARGESRTETVAAAWSARCQSWLAGNHQKLFAEEAPQQRAAQKKTEKCQRGRPPL